MANQFPPVTINFASLRVPGGVAGLPLLAIVIVTAIALPEARWLLLSGIVCGALLAAAMIFRRRRHGTWHPPSDDLRIVPDNFDGPRESDVTRNAVRQPDPRGWRLTPATTPR